MKTEVGEQIAGAYLKYILGCGFISYNVRPTTGGLTLKTIFYTWLK
jgi:hypothetical protein